MNNNDNLEKFIQEIESIKMTSLEKNKMRNHLTSFAISYTPVVSPYHHISTILRRGLTFAFVAILTVGSLSDFASVDALPGEAWYAVKIAHEEIKVATKLDTKKKISYEIKRTEKRIQEATTLAKNSDLDVKKQESIAQNIQEQTVKIAENIEKVKKEEPEEALILNSELKSTIKVNSKALRQASTSKQKKETSREIETEESDPEKTTIETETTQSGIATAETGENIRTSDLQEESSEFTMISKDEVSDTEATQTEQTQETERSPENIEIEQADLSEFSFAEELLGKINKEVEVIQAFEEKVTEEIIASEELNEKKEVETSLSRESNPAEEYLKIEAVPTEDVEVIIMSDQEKDPLAEPGSITVTTSGTEKIINDEQKEVIEQIDTETSTTQDISNSIDSLEDILVLEKRIAELKNELGSDEIKTKILLQENIFNEGTLRVQADIFIADQKYKQAFLALKEILSYYREKIIVKEVESDLGMEIEEENSKKPTIQ